MCRAERTLDVRWCRNSPVGSDRRGRAGAHNNPAQAATGPPASPLALACRQEARWSLLFSIRCSLFERFIEIGHLIYETGHAVTFQISVVYSEMVRSLENF